MADRIAYPLAEMNDLLTSAPASWFAQLPRPEMGDAYRLNYVIAMVEMAAHRAGVVPPLWTVDVPPLAAPVFIDSSLRLRAHLLTASPPPFGAATSSSTPVSGIAFDVNGRADPRASGSSQRRTGEPECPRGTVSCGRRRHVPGLSRSRSDPRHRCPAPLMRSYWRSDGNYVQGYYTEAPLEQIPQRP